MSPSKVPEVTALFWMVKVLTTGMGETASDFFVRLVDPVLMVDIGFAAFIAALVLQFSVRSYIPWAYWLAVVMVSVFGTMAADVLHIVIGLPYLYSSVVFAVCLGGVFTLWFLVERTLSVHSIVTRRREVFYWAAVLTTFALGTAVGDLTAVTFHLGYLASGLVFAAAIAVPALAFRFARLSAVGAFWCAYVLTRPLGASFADWMGVSHTRGGLNGGDGPVTLALTVLIVAFVALMTFMRSRPIESTPGTYT